MFSQKNIVFSKKKKKKKKIYSYMEISVFKESIILLFSEKFQINHLNSLHANPLARSPRQVKIMEEFV